MNSVRLENVYQASNVCRIQKRHSLKLLSSRADDDKCHGQGTDSELWGAQGWERSEPAWKAGARLPGGEGVCDGHRVHRMSGKRLRHSRQRKQQEPG